MTQDGATELKELSVGDMVRVQHHMTKRWDLIGEVIEIRPRGRSYLIRSESGRLYWRNRRFLRPFYGKSDSGPQERSEEKEEDKGLRRRKREHKQRVIYNA